MSRRYPLEPLHALRRRERQQRADELVEQLARTRAAQQQAQRARREHELQQDRSRHVVATERQRLQEGTSRAADLQQAQAWQVGAELRETQLAALEQDRVRRVGAEQLAQRRAQQVLSSADADAKLLERHHQSWQRRQLRARQVAQQEATEEAWSAARQSGRRRRREGNE